MKFSTFVFALLMSTPLCYSSVLQLTAENFDKLTEGKTVFIKFFAPWCGHCKAMASDFEKLASDWEGHPVGLVAEVDCTDDEDGGAVLCETFKVEGFPTLMYGDVSSLESYEGGRDYESMSEFAKENISKPVCSISNLDVCGEEQKALIKELEQKSKEDLEAIVADVDKKIDDAQEAYEKGLEELNETYERMTKELGDTNTQLKESSNYKWVKQVLSKMNGGADANVSDEL